ncbi:5-formyltetrahydrofolate cyclo-ligase [Paratissierella segnis]|uniref:5-formyltetrahydrofolate cyclo-ligase n=1 Tax=Paratissierella segnis TaxID=2763679 RepID=A0A926IIG3_9FIRM|nr:5-formyltetrahydrofolate cyclo-ligase [Paratissierella segnis]MBC8586934.1 5-formyltetrahydrofolate cyclo-ligase [Paratissierella segnis]
MDKTLLRRQILDKRSKLGKNEHEIYSNSILNSLLNSAYYKNSKTIMTFVSFSDEVDTHELIKAGIRDDKNLVVPITIKETKELKLSLVTNFNELEPGYYNILTPKKEFIRYKDPELVDLIIVPGVVFDREGYRIGYGGGYYDRFLSKIDKNVPRIAIAFDLQIIDKVPREYYDIPVDYIITEKEIIDCNNSQFTVHDSQL